MVKDISYPQATLGTKVDVETLNGFERLKIPDGTQNGDTFKIAGKGMPNLHGRSFGDLYVGVNVKIPKKISRKAKKLLEDLGEELEEN